MLPEIVSEVLRFFNREFLDELCYVSRRLHDVIEKAPTVYALRHLLEVNFKVEVELHRHSKNGRIQWLPKANFVAILPRSRFLIGYLDDLDEAMSMLSRVIKHSYIERLLFEFDGPTGGLRIAQDRWNSLVAGLQQAVVKRLHFRKVAFNALKTDSLFELLDFSGLRELEMHFCTIPSSFVPDNFLRLCDSSGLQRLYIDRRSELFEISEEALLDLYFPVDGEHQSEKRVFELGQCRVSASFVRRVFEVPYFL